MGPTREQVLNKIAGLFESQSLAVLSTQKNNQPYASLVAFAASADLEYIYFLTPRKTRKYENLRANPQVAVLVNDSLNQPDDIYEAVSVTGTGVSEVIDPSVEEKALGQYLKIHPHLEAFSKASDTAFIRIAMEQYVMVNQFQNVVEVRVKA